MNSFVSAAHLAPTATVAAIAEEFFREGCVVIPNILTAAEVAALRAGLGGAKD